MNKENWEATVDSWTFDFAKFGGMYLSPSEMVLDAKQYIKSFISTERARAREEEQQRAEQIARYWNIEIPAEIMAQADINESDLPMFRRACTFIADEIAKGEPAPIDRTPSEEGDNQTKQ